MELTIVISPEVEKSLLARAQAQGVSLDNYLQEIVSKEAGVATSRIEPTRAEKRYENLSDLLLDSPFAGANLDLDRSQEFARPVDLR